jgi:hypothetical protein
MIPRNRGQDARATKNTKQTVAQASRLPYFAEKRGTVVGKMPYGE